MAALRLVAVVSFGATILVLACSSDDEKVAPAYPEQGDGGRSSTSSTSSSTSGGGSSGTPAATDTYCGVLTKTIDGLEKCCTAEDKAAPEYGNFEFARVIYSNILCPAIEADLANGRMRLDKAAEATCVSAGQQLLAKLACPLPPEWTTSSSSNATTGPCRNVYVGTVAENGACRGDHECVDGLTCVGWTPQADGACKQPPALNETCGAGKQDADAGKPQPFVTLPFGTHPECAPNLHCSLDRVCVASAAEGEFCGGDSLCANNLKCYQAKCGGPGPSDADGPCVRPEDCKDGLWCDAVYPNAGTCHAKKGTGETCTRSDECRGRCVAADGGTGTCAAFCGRQ